MGILMHYLLIGRLERLVAIVLVGFFACVMAASGGKLVLKIQAVNKSDSPQPVEIRSSLPSRVTVDDIIDQAGLNLGYDVKSDTYYVFDTVQLAPKEIFVREVEIRDIWEIPDEDIDSLRKRAETLASLLAGSRRSAEATEQRSLVETRCGEMIARQSDNRITVVSPIRHIQAYEQNLKALQEVRQSVGRLENLAMAEGINPGEELIGEDRNAAAPRRDIHFPKEYGEAIVKITVHNSSESRVRKIDVRRDMAPEITIDDVLDDGGLAVRYDPKARVTYVFKDDLEVPPKETVTFEVRIRDKWNINGERIQFLREKVSELQVMTSGRDKIDAVEATLKDAEETLGRITEEKGPDTLSPAYIAFYRRQADQLDEVERALNRVDSALKPLETKRGFDIPAPDKKTTWLIIYVILGFLAVVSLLFFLRWYVRSA
jgi:hypothetical protein